MKISIRPYEPKDRLALTAMATSLIDLMSTLDSHHIFRRKEQFDADAYIDCRIRLINKSHGKIFVAQMGDSLVGYVMCTMEIPSEIDTLNKLPCRIGTIDALFVESSQKGGGIGSQLMQSAEKYLKEAGATHCALGCIAENTDAHKFYKNFGFTAQYIDYLKPIL